MEQTRKNGWLLTTVLGMAAYLLLIKTAVLYSQSNFDFYNLKIMKIVAFLLIDLVVVRCFAGLSKNGLKSYKLWLGLSAAALVITLVGFFFNNLCHWLSWYVKFDGNVYFSDYLWMLEKDIKFSGGLGIFRYVGLFVSTYVVFILNYYFMRFITPHIDSFREDIDNMLEYVKSENNNDEENEEDEDDAGNSIDE